MFLKFPGSPTDHYLLHDGIALADDTPDIIRDENGVPIEWPLLKIGENPILKNGQPGSITLSPADMQSIIDYHQAKGCDIPIDSRHFIHYLATEKGLDEAEVLKLMPDGIAALGFGTLAMSGEQLRIRAKWTPTAYELVKAKIFRYFSPALRGLVNPPLRLTSVAMENEPAINHLDALAASANNRGNQPQNKKGSDMTKIEKALAALLGRDSLALEADGDSVASAVEGKGNLIAEFRKSLGVQGSDDNLIVIALKNLIEKAGGASALETKIQELQTKVDGMAAAAETKKKTDLIEQGLREGKITPATKEWWEKLDSTALSSLLPTAQVISPPGPVDRGNLAPAADNVALTDVDRETCRRFGYTEEAFLAAKKAQMKG